MFKNKGFTLIELIVVISIIGFISTIVLTQLSDSRKKTRDSIRVQQLVQLTRALQLYATNNGVFPIAATALSSEPGDGAISNNGGNWIPGLTGSTTISVLPRDPLGNTPDNWGAYAAQCGSSKRAYHYVTDASGSEYVITIRCAVEINSFGGSYIDATYPYQLKFCSNKGSTLCTNTNL